MLLGGCGFSGATGPSGSGSGLGRGDVLVHERDLERRLDAAVGLDLEHHLLVVPLGGARHGRVVHVAGHRQRLEVGEHAQLRDRSIRPSDGLRPGGEPHGSLPAALDGPIEVRAGQVHGASRDLHLALDLGRDLRETFPAGHGRVSGRRLPAAGEVVLPRGRQVGAATELAGREPDERRRTRLLGPRERGQEDRQRGRHEQRDHEGDADELFPVRANRHQQAVPFGLSLHEHAPCGLTRLRQDLKLRSKPTLQEGSASSVTEAPEATNRMSR